MSSKILCSFSSSQDLKILLCIGSSLSLSGKCILSSTTLNYFWLTKTLKCKVFTVAWARMTSNRLHPKRTRPNFWLKNDLKIKSRTIKSLILILVARSQNRNPLLKCMLMVRGRLWWICRRCRCRGLINPKPSWKNLTSLPCHQWASASMNSAKKCF